MATVGPTNLPAFFSTDTDFRTWGSTISAALATLGLVQTADTGQINWTTVTKPSAINTMQGYEIWRFADTLQATTPIYMKIQYGSGGAVDRPAINFQVGGGSSGAGGLTGQASAANLIQTSGSKSAGVTLPFYASGNSGELIVAFNLDTVTTTFGGLFAVERPKDNTDATTSEGVLVTWVSANTTSAQQYVPPTGAVPAQSGVIQAIHPNWWARSASGANVDIGPIFIPLGGVWRFSHINIAKVGDMAFGGTYSASILGGTHTYLSIDEAAGANFNVSSTVVGVSFRWE